MNVQLELLEMHEAEVRAGKSKIAEEQAALQESRNQLINRQIELDNESLNLRNEARKIHETRAQFLHDRTQLDDERNAFERERNRPQVPQTVDSLDDEDALIRSSAAYALGMIAPETAVAEEN